MIGFDLAGRIGHGLRDQGGEGLGQVIPAGRHIQHGGDPAMLVEHRRAHAAHHRVAVVEVLVAIDRDRALLGDARADAVRALHRFGPDTAFAEASRAEKRAVGVRHAVIDHHTFGIGEEHAATGQAEAGIEAVHHRRGGGEDPAEAIAALVEFGLLQPGIGIAGSVGLQAVSLHRARP